MPDENMKQQFNEIVSKVEKLENNLNSIKKAISKFEDEHLTVDYTKIEGEFGKFDGFDMITDDGKRFKVNPNYAAKSKLVFGDVLKLIEEDGKQLFKQVDRVNRTKVEGILTKKEGEWYMLNDRGSYKVSDAAAEYQNAELNAEVVAYLPTDNMDAPFATIDFVEGSEEEKKVKKEEKDSKKEEVKQAKKETEAKKETKGKKKTRKKSTSTKKPTTKKKSSKTKDKNSTKSKEKDDSKKSDKKEEESGGKKKILADDDLV